LSIAGYGCVYKLKAILKLFTRGSVRGSSNEKVVLLSQIPSELIVKEQNIES
jgi:hypothetical protein